MAHENAWSLLASAVPALRHTRPSRVAAVVFPRSSIYAQGDEEFDAMIRSLRELFSFDLVDETELPRLASGQYPLLIVPFGSLWSPEALAALEQQVRTGSALVVRMDQPWRDSRGDIRINERLFRGRVVQQGEEMRIEPWQEDKRITEGDPYTPAGSRSVQMGGVGDVAYLAGKWGNPENAYTAQRYGFPFRSFRWFRERAMINLPMIPGRDYQLEIEGFLPQGRTVYVVMNGKPLGTIEGQGTVKWTRPLTGALRPRTKDVQVVLRGQEWSPGEVLGATQSYSVTMAVSRVALAPLRGTAEAPEENPPLPTPNFERELLRGTLLREVGRGVTLLVPKASVNDWMFQELLSTLVVRPQLLDPRYNFSEPPDGERNRVYMSSQAGTVLYLNLTSEAVQVGGRAGTRRMLIPPRSIFYTF